MLDTARQIVEFEELVSRLDRINDVVVRRSSRTSTSTSVPPPSPPARATTSHLAASSLPYDRPVSDATRSPVDDERQRVRVHIGIDEDLRMILEMDPSIVDGTLAPVVAPDSHSTVVRSLRATRLQGWYCTDRETNSLVSGVICAHSIQLYYLPLISTRFAGISRIFCFLYENLNTLTVTKKVYTNIFFKYFLKIFFFNILF